MTLNDIIKIRALFCFISLNSYSFRGALRKTKVVDNAITMDNLRLLCLVTLVVNVCRGTARRPRYKYSIIAKLKFCSRFMNSRLNAQYLRSYRLDRKSYMSFRLLPKSVTLNCNGKMALILRYFAEFCSFRGASRKNG